MKPFLLLPLVTLSLATASQNSSNQLGEIHPGFRCDAAKAVALYDKGYQDADSMKDLRLFYKESARTSIQVISAQYEAYRMGFRAKKAFLEEDKIRAERDSLATMVSANSFSVVGTLSSSPSAAIKDHGPDGEVRYTLPDVRMVMKIGDRVYRPQTQPGDLRAEYKAYDYTTIESGSRTETVKVPNGDGSYHEEKTVIPTTDSVRHADSWLTTPVESTFNLFNEDGTPRIQPSDKEMTLFVIVGTTQKQFKYKLSDFSKFESMKPPKGDFFKRFKKG